MSDETFDTDAWLSRIGLPGRPDPNLAGLRSIIAAHSATIPFENIDVLLGRPPKLDLASLQRKMIAGRRGGYCFEQNTLLRSGLISLGFRVTCLLARVIRGMDAEASGPQTHMTLRVDLDEGPFLADVGFGNQTPTAPLAMRPNEEQATPHETMRLWPVGDELTLQAKLGDDWQNIYRLSHQPRLPIDYEVANWFTATHPASPFVSNLIAARPSTERTRQTLFNNRTSVRRPGHPVERSVLENEASFAQTLESAFGIVLTGDDLTQALAILDRKGTRDVSHPFFA